MNGPPWIEPKVAGWTIAVLAAFFGLLSIVKANGHCEHTEWRTIDVVVGKGSSEQKYYQVCADPQTKDR